jgi:hypothetical protein
MRTWMKVSLTLATTALLVTTGVAAASPPGTGNDPAAGAAPAADSPAVAVAPSTLETVFVPITPCRIIDTRSAGGQIATGTTRAFHVRGSTDFTSQGGNATGCGIPESATAVAVSVTPTAVAKTGYLHVWPYGQAEPNATIAHYFLGQTNTTGATITLGSGIYDINAKTYTGATSLVVDLTGYYAPQMAAFVALDGTLQFATPRVTAASHVSTGNYIVTFDTDVSRCSFAVTPYAYNWVAAVGPQIGNVNQAHVYIHEQAGSTTAHDNSFFIQAVC